jgi:glyoxylase-like metal-dependent hydrolase (beta-lactamase superfamily II)
METNRRMLAFDRRSFLAAAAGFIAAGVLPEKVLALAQPFTLKLGAAEATVVSDGLLVFPAEIVAPEAPPAEIRRLLGLASDAKNAEMAANVLLLRSGGEVILFDTGSGPDFQPSAGKLVETLRLVGVAPEVVTRIVFTHAHPDHLWGTITAAGQPVFPKAVYHVGETEWGFWTDPGLLAKLPADFAPFVTGAQRQLAAIKDRVTLFKPGADIVSGVRAIDLVGHTPGHAGFEISGGDGLIVSADVLPSERTHFANPGWSFGFDAIPDAAVATRKALLDRAATDRTPVLGYHWTYPGIGRAAKAGAGYKFEAL